MIPTGTPASTTQRITPSGELNSIGMLSEPSRLKMFQFISCRPLQEPSELEIAAGHAGSFTLALAHHHITNVADNQRGDAEEDSGISDGPAAHFAIQLVGSGRWSGV